MRKYQSNGRNNMDEEIDDEELEPQTSPEQIERRNKFHELSRLFSQANWTIQCLKIVGQLEQICSELREGFLVFAYRSLWDDALSCLMRILDKHPEAFSLWKIDNLEGICEEEHIDIQKIEEFSGRLRKARNKCHFHNDKEYAADADQLWSKVAIKEKEMVKVANDVATILGRLLWEEHQVALNLSLYDASDVRPILECLDKCGLGNFRKR